MSYDKTNVELSSLPFGLTICFLLEIEAQLRK